MITKTKQNWTVGSTVKVGFMSLTVKAAVVTPNDYLPDAYILTNAAGTQLYKFVPHNGLEKISIFEAKEMLDISENHANKMVAKIIANAMASREIDVLFA